MNEIVIEPIDLNKWRLFKQHFDVFTILEEQKVLEIQYGKATLNFAGGILQTVVREEVVYKRLSTR